MRILQICHSFYPCFAAGGVVRAAYGLSKKLVENGHDVTVYTTDGCSQRLKVQKNTPLTVDGIRVYYFRNLSNWLRIKLKLATPYYLSFIMGREARQFDIIHIHEYRTTLAILAHHYAKKYGIPYIIQAHGSLPKIMTKQRLKQIYDILWGYRLLKDASKVIALTKTEAEQYRSMGVSEDKIEIVPNGINLAEFDNLPQRGEFRKKWGINNNEKIILYLARIHKVKGPDLLTKAFAELAQEINNIRLVIVGPDDGYLPALKKLISELGIEDQVLLTGPLYGRDKLKAYVDADIYVLPSFYETFPISVLEACACGAPVIVTDRCGIANIINGQAGLAVPYDEGALGKAILSLMNDDKKRQELGERGKLLVRERFNWNRIVHQLEGIYGECQEGTG